MILSINWLFHIWFIKALPINYEVVFVLLNSDFFVLVEELVLLMAFKTQILLIGRPSDIRSN